MKITILKKNFGKSPLCVRNVAFDRSTHIINSLTLNSLIHSLILISFTFIYSSCHLLHLSRSPAQIAVLIVRRRHQPLVLHAAHPLSLVHHVAIMMSKIHFVLMRHACWLIGIMWVPLLVRQVQRWSRFATNRAHRSTFSRLRSPCRRLSKSIASSPFVVTPSSPPRPSRRSQARSCICTWLHTYMPAFCINLAHSHLVHLSLTIFVFSLNF